MDLDAFVAAHHREWERLEQLASGRRRLSGAEADELLDLYQRVATHLSEIRSTAPDPTLVAHLSSVLAGARSRSAGTRTATWAGLARFFAETFPAALYRARRWWLTTMAVSLAAAWLMGWWFVRNPRFEQSLLPPEEIDRLVNSDFESYYTEYAASSFAFQVWTNNAWVAALCIALGVLGVPVVLLLFSNLVNLSLVGALMWRFDRAGVFFGLVLPHGLLELTAVFVAAGVGLRVFWAWVDPGPRTRMGAIAQEGRAATSVALGLAVVLLATGLIEAFVTPSALPTWARIGVGATAEALFLGYVFTVGRWSSRRGETGDVSLRDQGDAAPVGG